MPGGTVPTGNFLIDTQLSSERIASGQSVMVIITYTTDNSGKSIQITHDPGFSVTPLKVSAPPGVGMVVRAQLTVHRKGSTYGSVLLTFNLAMSYQAEVLRVLP
ncbi:hypothetical protein [Hyalangium sp.]|uniref:hypothetical protein n=1 Tax=Hyalangium sp. TaxID=2028555 RepID=UPI002D74F0CE|nr:hypothetical protein [Hyalangium sp.]HYI00183.1 hypothetical protein [Hyalangium sp.]